jgi:hypothetical protein
MPSTVQLKAWNRQAVVALSSSRHHPTTATHNLCCTPLPVPLHNARPLLPRPHSYPTPALCWQVCHQCLSTRVTPRRQAAPDTLPHFCSWECHSAALSSYFSVESRLYMGGLAAYCKKQEEKMPLMAARLACSLMQEAMRQASRQELQQAHAAWPGQLQRRAAAARFPGTRLGGAEPGAGSSSSSSSSRAGAISEGSSSSSDEEAWEGPADGRAPLKPYQSWSRAGEWPPVCHQLHNQFRALPVPSSACNLSATRLKTQPQVVTAI